jgi:hypothetical protein
MHPRIESRTHTVQRLIQWSSVQPMRTLSVQAQVTRCVHTTRKTTTKADPFVPLRRLLRCGIYETSRQSYTLSRRTQMKSCSFHGHHAMRLSWQVHLLIEESTSGIYQELAKNKHPKMQKTVPQSFSLCMVGTPLALQ